MKNEHFRLEVILDRPESLMSHDRFVSIWIRPKY